MHLDRHRREDGLPWRAFVGTVRGHILPARTGEGGFGYDPLFIPDGYDNSFADLGPSTKNTLSHRAKALAKLAGFF